MFRRWPFFQRLLSWTKPHAPAPRGSRAYERYDWNSLLGDDAGDARPAAGIHGRVVVLPVPAGDGGEPHGLRRARPASPSGTAAAGRRRRWRTGRTGAGSSSRPRDGTYRAEALIVAVGVAEPYTPPGPGMEHAAITRTSARPRATPGKRVFIVGKQNSGFELANGLLPWARQLVLASPSTARLSVDTRSLVGVRARYVQPYEDHVLGGGVAILDAAIERIEPVPAATASCRSHLRRTDGGGDLALEVDEVISATGFVCPLQDLPELGVDDDRARPGCPARRRGGRAPRCPGCSSRGPSGRGRRASSDTASRATRGPSTGPATTPACSSAHLATTRFGSRRTRPRVAAADLVDLVTRELAEAPELWHQRGYLARVITADPDGGLVDDGVQPLSHVLDAGGARRAGVHARSRRDGRDLPGPVHAGSRGTVSERMVDPDPLLRYDGPDARRVVEEVVRSVVPDAVAR